MVDESHSGPAASASARRQQQQQQQQQPSLSKTSPATTATATATSSGLGNGGDNGNGNGNGKGGSLHTATATRNKRSHSQSQSKTNRRGNMSRQKSAPSIGVKQKPQVQPQPPQNASNKIKASPATNNAEPVRAQPKDSALKKSSHHAKSASGPGINVSSSSHHGKGTKNTASNHSKKTPEEKPSKSNINSNSNRSAPSSSSSHHDKKRTPSPLAKSKNASAAAAAAAALSSSAAPNSSAKDPSPSKKQMLAASAEAAATSDALTDSLLEASIDLRRSYTMPNIRTDSSEAAAAATGLELRTSHSDNVLPSSSSSSTHHINRNIKNTRNLGSSSHHRLDRYGFILNIDSLGNVVPSADLVDGGGTDDHHRSTAAIGEGGGRDYNSKDENPTASVGGGGEGKGGANNTAGGRMQYPWQDRSMTPVEKARNERRIRKWNHMIGSSSSSTTNSNNNNNKHWEQTARRRPKLVQRRLRKGIPDSIRGAVWATLGQVQARQSAQGADLYETLLHKTVYGSNHQRKGDVQTNRDSDDDDDAAGRTSRIDLVGTGSNGSSSKSSFRSIQETIERDIHRTFPRHSMFFDDGTNHDGNILDVEKGNDDDVEDDGEDNTNRTPDFFSDDGPVASALCGSADLSSMIRQLEQLPHSNNNSMVKSTSIADRDKSHKNNSKTPANSSHHQASGATSAEAVLQSKGGQASLRRVLKAYSMYDREIGYCQGMNFIAGMFLTLMSEEEAFWMLVAIMNDQPCRMRGLFGEGMRETHKVLYVAEKLIQQFLPKLAKHFDKEHVHITMFATQWLLTQYTSSFRFDLVTRVWDCFLYEGWKVTYRVMLSILIYAQPTLLKMSFEDILAYFRELPDKIDGGAIVDASLKIPLRKSHIAKLERDWDVQQPTLT